MGRARRSKGNDCVSPRHRSSLFAHDIGVGAGRNVHGNYRNAAGIDPPNGLCIQAVNRRLETRAKNRIDQEIRFESALCGADL